MEVTAIPLPQSMLVMPMVCMCCMYHVLSLPPSLPPSPHSLSPLSQLWAQCHSKKRAPCRMTRGSATTDHQFAYFTPLDSTSVYQYEWSTDQWKELPSCPYHDSGLVIIDGELTAVGGASRGFFSGYSPSDKLFTLRQRKWVEEYPPMKTAQYSPAVVSASDGDYIIVIGGVRLGDWTAAVELFQVKTRRWYETRKLPQPLLYPSATVCGDQVHVISGGYGDYKGYSCSLPSSDRPITSQLLSHLLSWKPLPRLPVAESTAVTLCGQLVIIGGQRDLPPRGVSLVNSVHQLLKGQWVEICSMTSRRRWCLSVSPSPDKLMIVGGYGALDNVEECTIAQ